MLAVAHALETHKTISGDDVVAIVEGTVGPLGRRWTLPRSGRAEPLEHYHAA